EECVIATVLALDGGGTTTHCLLVDTHAGLLADVEGPFCALAIDEQRSLETLADTITKAVRQAQGHWIQTSSEPLRIDAACVGMSGLLAMQAEDRVRSGVHA